jgi:hypothetical protein
MAATFAAEPAATPAAAEPDAAIGHALSACLIA